MRLVQNGFANNFGLVGKTLRRALATTALTATSIAVLATPALAGDNDWSQMQYTSGSGTMDTSVANTTSFQQHTSSATIRGDADIDPKITVNYMMNSNNDKVVVFDTENDPTLILGKLNSNGRVYIFDQNGVIFGKGSQVNVGSIVASTGSISETNLNNDKLVFENIAGEGAIEMKGTINIADAGLAAFVAPTVVNSGVINAKMGNVVLASGEKVSIDLYGDNLIEVAVDGALENALIKNSGAINANGGNVVITAKAAKDAVDNVINMSGIVDVSSVSTKGGKIVLSGGKKSTVKVSGKLDASGTTGGNISVTGHKVNLTETSEIVSTGDESNVYVYGTDKAIFRGSAVVGKDAALEISGRELVLGGSVTAGEGSTISFDPAIFDIGAAEAATFVSAMNNFGVTVDIAATDAINLNADIDTSAQVTDSILNFKDENADNNLTVNLNAKVILGALQSLIGDASVVNVAGNDGITQPTLIQNGIDVAKDAIGAVVNVAAGTFSETIDIVKNNITLKGANAGLAGYSPARGAETFIRPSAVIPLPTTDYGINVAGNDVTIDGFTIMQFDNGIQADGVTGLDIRNNSITIANKNGVFINNSSNIDMMFNEILATGHEYDGVHVANSTDVNLKLNAFGDPDPFWDINGDAIYFENVNGGNINNNTIQGTRQFGETDGNGIHIKDSTNVNVGDGAFGYNVIHDTAWNGVWIQGGSNNNVLGNFIDHSGHAGILGETTSQLVIDDNYVEDSGWGGWGGITNIFGDNIQITNNEVFNYATSGSNVGISMAAVNGGNNVISGNNVHDTNGIGIHAFNNVNTDILGNTVKNTDLHGIYLANSSGALNVNGNIVGAEDGSTQIGWNGIWVQNISASDVSIADNFVYHAQANGIEVTNVEQTATIARNLVNDTKERGLYVSGPSNGLVIIDDNDFNRFDEGGVFQSGTIDLVTGATNTFTNGRVGLLFSPYSFGEGFAFLGLVDDDGEPDTLFPAIPGNFDGSIGAQIFSNISEYYVELDNEAFFAPGFPTWLNGLNSTYDGLTPASTLGALTQTELDALEAKFFHYIDRQDLGLFFLGFVPQPVVVPTAGPDINEALIFNQFDPFNGDITGLNVRVTGLPNTGVGATGGGFAGPANLNNIQTFAGGNTPEDLNNIQTAAGGESGNQPTEQDLGEIETEAGANSESTNCWSDAMSTAGGGQAVNVVYGGSFADNLNQAAACGTAF